MGLDIDRERFDADDRRRFTGQLERGLAALRGLLVRPGFGEGPASVGAELEVFLVDASGAPLCEAPKVLAALADPRVTAELNTYDLEINTRPAPLAGRPFAHLEEELASGLGAVREAASAVGGEPATVGILPTLEERHLGADVICDLPRYVVLSRTLREMRGEDFRIVIDGLDPLTLRPPEVAAEGANTAFQVHLRVPPSAYADTYDAIQLATAPVLAACGNSPTFLGHRLWAESRIALFKQAVDVRTERAARRPPRVGLGTGWTRDGAHELFAQNVALFEALLPAAGDEDAPAVVRAGGVPELLELRLHQSTVWSWNRAVYDGGDGGHLRVEARALPAGPTPVDMVANAAFLLGLALGLRPEMDTLRVAMPFELARTSFYRAAQLGLDAELAWPTRQAPSPVARRAPELALELIPVAKAGLEAAGVLPDEAQRCLSIIEARVRSGRTGARWQLDTLAAIEARSSRADAIRAMFQAYRVNAATGAPVHTWPSP